VIGIATYGAIDGQPARVHNFVSGLHTAGLFTAGLFVLAAGAATALIPAQARRECAGHVR
jgi:hypothetical protein